MDNLPVGFRFYPTEEELVSFYLLNKLNGTRADIDSVIPVVHIYDYNPWDLPQLAGERCRSDTEQWFFFTPRQEREARGGKPNRLTQKGYWKATGSPGDVYSSQNLRIGRKKTMVFYEGRAPNGRKTAWKMNEYKVFDGDHESPFSADADQQVKGELSLCRIYKKSKCMRVFDRLPPTEAETGNRAAAHHHQHHTTETIKISDQQNPAAVEEITNCMVDSSSSGDHTTYHYHSVESENNCYVATEDDPMWDWEELNWF